MGKEQPASYYDAGYKKSPEYSKPWQQSRYLKVWQRMSQRLDKEIMVIDLGCGIGQTASFLHDQSFKSYFGVDFSFYAIAQARELHSAVTGYWFRCEDLFEFIQTVDVHDTKIQFFCSETLEHIQKDTELLKLLAEKFPGSRIAISVPTFDDPGHVRHFKGTADAKARYAPFVKIDDLSQIGPWIIIQGTLRADLEM